MRPDELPGIGHDPAAFEAFCREIVVQPVADERKESLPHQPQLRTAD